jgi:predicted nucleic acid-binding protein
MAPVVVDSSVILGLFDPQDALHAVATMAVRSARDAGHAFVLPASVLAEVLVGAARRGTAELELRHLQVIKAFGSPHGIDERTAVVAAAWRARHASLRLPDALVLATADIVGADAVLTGDKRWSGLDPRLRVVG